jgi:hypothetical protein
MNKERFIRSLFYFDNRKAQYLIFKKLHLIPCHCLN